jgi:Uma2 family endonuclease
MGTKALISPEQYLATHYEREPEYVRGELKEKPMPDRLHRRIQVLLGVLLNSLSSVHRLSAESEVRCRLAPDVYRLPDVALFDLRKHFDLLPTEPPLLVIEIVSTDERYTELLEKLLDYETWGVPRIWLVNPWNRQLAVWKDGTMRTVDALTLPEYGFEVRMDQLLEGIELPK